MKTPQLVPLALGLSACAFCLTPELVAQSSLYGADQAFIPPLS